MKLRITLVFVALLCAAGMPFLVQTNSEDTSKQLPLDKALSIVRAIGTVQAEVKSKENRYLSLEDVLKYGSFPRRHEVSLNGRTSGTVKNYKLSVVLSDDSQHYQILLVPESGCGSAFFSNEDFVIYEGKALGCPKS